MKVFESIKKMTLKPEPYAQGTIRLWEDPHIAKGMLESHLEADADGASRPHAFIDASVKWMAQMFPKESHPKVMDFGCGPGLYTLRLAKMGYSVSGIDVSKNSIAYAQNEAQKEGLSIHYQVGNYLTFCELEAFDLALLIYCDYGVLSDQDRLKLLKNIHKGLRPGGKLIFDVFTPEKYKDTKRSNEWSLYEAGDFFKPTPHLLLTAHWVYEDHLHLDQYLLLSPSDHVDVIRVWDKCFTEKSLTQEVLRAGFKPISVHADVAGGRKHEDSKTLCMVLEKI